LRGRHDLAGVFGEDACDELALARLARDEGTSGDGNVPNVEAKFGLARRTVRAVASEAVLGQDWADVPAVTDWVGAGAGSGQHQASERECFDGATCHRPSPA